MSAALRLIRRFRGQDSSLRRTALVALGGDVQRELFALHLADLHEFRDCTVFLTSGELDAEHPGIKRLGSRVIIDYSAVDTLSNFTSLLPLLRAAQVDCVVCVTSPNHAKRAALIGRIVLGFYGIRVKFRLISPSKAGPKESIWRELRDVLRAVFWVATGWAGHSIAVWVHPTRKQYVNGTGQRCIG